VHLVSFDIPCNHSESRDIKSVGSNDSDETCFHVHTLQVRDDPGEIELDDKTDIALRRNVQHVPSVFVTNPAVHGLTRLGQSFSEQSARHIRASLKSNETIEFGREVLQIKVPIPASCMLTLNPPSGHVVVLEIRPPMACCCEEAHSSMLICQGIHSRDDLELRDSIPPSSVDVIFGAKRERTGEVAAAHLYVRPIFSNEIMRRKKHVRRRR